jgi:hypothetical protein
MTSAILCTAISIQNDYLNLYWLYYENNYHIEKDIKFKLFYLVKLNFLSGNKSYSHGLQ